jgi:hypothetical protein
VTLLHGTGIGQASQQERQGELHGWKGGVAHWPLPDIAIRTDVRRVSTGATLAAMINDN